MIKVIINADDCGLDENVNASIERFIQKELISSTTLMANGAALESAKRLHDSYPSISFGAHLNLTELNPLRKSDLLLEKGIITHENILNAQEFRYKYLSREIRKELFLELDMQMQKLLDYGFNISHIDSHHHIHNGTFILPVFASLLKKYKISHIRRMRNYMPMSISLVVRQQWYLYLKMLNTKAYSTDYFVSYESFVTTLQKGISYCNKNQVVELMCHPGGIFLTEEELMEKKAIDNFGIPFKMINYNTIKK